MTRSLPVDCRYNSKEAALKAARMKCAQGKSVAVFHRAAGSYTESGYFFTQYSYYTVEEVV